MPIDKAIIREGSIDEPNVRYVYNDAFAPMMSIYTPVGDAADRQEFRLREGTRIIIELEGQIIGTAQYCDHQDHIHILGLAVRTDWQNMGVGRMILDEIILRAQQSGHKKVRVDTIKETGNVDKFLRWGFVVIKEREAKEFSSESFDRVHEVIMDKVIECEP